MKKTIYGLMAIVFISMAMLGSYIVLISFSENRMFTRSSVDYIFLTPSLLKDLPISPISDQSYTYSAEDGPKPRITTFTFSGQIEHTRIVDQVHTYLKSLGYVKKDAYHFEKPKEEVHIEYVEPNRIRIVFMEFFSGA